MKSECIESRELEKNLLKVKLSPGEHDIFVEL